MQLAQAISFPVVMTSDIVRVEGGWEEEGGAFTSLTFLGILPPHGRHISPDFGENLLASTALNSPPDVPTSTCGDLSPPKSPAPTWCSAGQQKDFWQSCTIHGPSNRHTLQPYGQQRGNPSAHCPHCTFTIRLESDEVACFHTAQAMTKQQAKLSNGRDIISHLESWRAGGPMW